MNFLRDKDVFNASPTDLVELRDAFYLVDYPVLADGTPYVQEDLFSDKQFVLEL